jgi:hypothetical protein
VDHVTYRELTDRRAWLLDVVAAVGPGANNVGARTAAVVLPTVLNELDTRAHAYKAAAGHAYSCTCGFSCIGLAAFDAHMDHYHPNPQTATPTRKCRAYGGRKYATLARIVPPGWPLLRNVPACAS